MFEEGASSSCLQGFYEQGSCVESTTLKDFQLIAITDAASCPRSLLEQVERIGACTHKPSKLILRAKELNAVEYAALAQQFLPLCQTYHIELMLHSHWQIALELGITQVHMPLPLLAQMPEELRRSLFISTSVHSITEAQQALALGANVLIAGHIYATSCKADLPPRGLEFLRSICAFAQQKCAKTKAQAEVPTTHQGAIQFIPQAVPVYAIGGIDFDTKQWRELRENGASGACIMSAYMKI